MAIYNSETILMTMLWVNEKYFASHLHPDATMATIIDVVVEELCRRTVARIPIIRPAIGLLTIDFEVNASPEI